MGNLFKRLVGDPALFLAALVMTSFGIAMIYSAGVLNGSGPGANHVFTMILKMWSRSTYISRQAFGYVFTVVGMNRSKRVT